ncbi:MAG: 1-acyl-sn-glycerol-3-phosphate acyltransferase [Endomicrobium sp.]|jgi:1-acyl-sn-glycerol-3-phosphate acyltransferase|nr:1-acyl-sn-glycerol-3-phosphate acyltransferase [Endomicrobium sp.]
MNRKEKSPILFLIGKMIFKVIFKLFYRWRIEGIENIPKIGGAIIVSRHVSFFDPPLVGSSIRRPLYFMAKKELFYIPILGWIIKRTNAFPVNRSTSYDITALRNAVSLLKAGSLLLIFPEGTRSKNSKVDVIKAGIGMMACNAQVPLIPVKIDNVDVMLKFNKIVIKYGKPIYPPKNFIKNDYITLSQKVLKTIAYM